MKRVTPFVYGLIFFLGFVTIVFAPSAFNSPSSCTKFQFWFFCNRAFVDDGVPSQVAGVNSTVNKTGMWYDYNFSIPSNSTITSVIVRADFWASNSSGYIDVRASGDGGVSYGPSHVVGGNTVEQTFLINITDDFSWVPDMLNNSNLRVNATCFKQGADPNTKCLLDWLPINVSYT